MITLLCLCLLQAVTSFTPPSPNNHQTTTTLSYVDYPITIQPQQIDDDITSSLNGKQLIFEENSLLMYEKLLEGHPGVVRRRVRRNVDRAIANKCYKIVTECDLYQVIKEESPRLLLDYNLFILDKHCAGMSLEKHFADDIINSSTTNSIDAEEKDDDGICEVPDNKRPLLQWLGVVGITNNNRMTEQEDKIVASNNNNNNNNNNNKMKVVTSIINRKEFHFQQNSKLMMDMLLEGTPEYIRQDTKSNIDNAIFETLCKDDNIVTESDMYEVVKMTIEKPFLRCAILLLDQFKTV